MNLKKWYRFSTSSPAGLIWFAVIAVVTIFFLAWKLPLDPDLFWHLQAGTDILENGVPRIDWYSHTFSEFAWVNHEYAQDVFMSVVHDIGGYRLLSIVYAILITLIFSLGLKWSLSKSLNWPWTLLTGFIITALAYPYLGVRSQMFSYLFILLTLGLLQRGMNGRLTYLWLTPIIFVVWSNWHASFLAGLLILVVVLATETFKFVLPTRINLGKVRDVKFLGNMLGVTVLSVLATFANPYGAGVWQETLRTLGDTDLHENILEWFPPDIYGHNGFLFFFVVLLLVAALALRRKHIDLTSLSIVLLFLAGGLTASRNAPLFYLVAAPAIAMTVRDYWPNFIKKILYSWPILVVLSLVLVGALYSRSDLDSLWNIDNRPYIFAERASFPVGAAQFLAEHPEYAALPAFNNYAWGGYLIKKVPNFKTFIDGRMPSWELNEVKIIDEYFKLDRLMHDWYSVINTYDVRLLILPPTHSLLTQKQVVDNFSEVYKDEQAVIMSKPPNQP